MISGEHLEMLAASGISAEHARRRGYESIENGRYLANLGTNPNGDRIAITRAGRSTPGLLIPLLRPDRSTWGYQYRPDVPRISDGKPVKYETPSRQRAGLDVPPGVAPDLGDPSVPLWITEGAKKAHAGAINGLCIVALVGVWSWRGANLNGGKVALADWHDVALNGRRVIIAFDGDVARKEPVQKAARALGDYLAAMKGARPEYLWLPDTDEKTGLDDYLLTHSVEELWALVQPTPPLTPTPIYPPDPSATPQHPRPTPMPTVALLRRILDQVAAEVRARGLVGEERLAQTLYLVLTSRLLDKQVSAGVKGHSASGKSYTVETVAGFFPPEAYLEFTGMSEHALVYSPEQFSHRTLIVYEVVALREGVEDDMTSYFIRSLLSEGRIDYEVTVRTKDDGFTTRKIVKEGPTNLIFTTTKTRVHAENETRILSLTTDDSTAQTARVLAELADETNGDGAGDLEQWRDLQRWLAGAEHRVTIPYAKALTRRIPPVAVRLRRDVGALLALIRAHAVLHQATRGRDPGGRVIATLDDYAVVRDLVADLLAEGVGATVSATVRETVGAVAALAEDMGEVSARAAAVALGIDKSNAGRRLRVAADGGYLKNLEDKRGKPARWVTADPLPDEVELLPSPAELEPERNTATVSTPFEQECCGVAAESEGYTRDADETDETDDAEDGEIVLCWYCGDEIPPDKPLARTARCCNKGRCIQASLRAITE
jgi:hypothetical protein